VLASLNHPNIAQIDGYEESGSVDALVMEPYREFREAIREADAQNEAELAVIKRAAPWRAAAFLLERKPPFHVRAPTYSP
jgi:hypothetical protein